MSRSGDFVLTERQTDRRTEPIAAHVRGVTILSI